MDKAEARQAGSEQVSVDDVLRLTADLQRETALLMASLQASFHAWADELVGVPEMTGRLSEAISRRTGPDRFITFFLLLLDPASGKLTVTDTSPSLCLTCHDK